MVSGVGTFEAVDGIHGLVGSITAQQARLEYFRVIGRIRVLNRIITYPLAAEVKTSLQVEYKNYEKLFVGAAITHKNVLAWSYLYTKHV